MRTTLPLSERGLPELAATREGARSSLLPGLSPWTCFLPVMRNLVQVLRPRVAVELGSGEGASFCPLCEAMATAASSTGAFSDLRAYAVDEWPLYPEAAEAPDRVNASAMLARLQRHCHRRYPFARLLRIPPRLAAARFSESQPVIDLLQVRLDPSGMSSADLASWLTRVRRGGVTVIGTVEGGGANGEEGRPAMTAMVKELRALLESQGPVYVMDAGEGATLTLGIKGGSPDLEAWFVETMSPASSASYGLRGRELVALAAIRESKESCRILSQQVSQLQTVMEDARDLSGRNQTLHDRNQELQSEVHRLIAATGALMVQREALSAENAQLAEQCHALRVACDQCQAVCEAESAKKQFLRQKLADLRVRYTRLQQVHERVLKGIARWNERSWVRRVFHRLRVKD